jgi:predicted phage terminase large subunit-like protein
LMSNMLIANQIQGLTPEQIEKLYKAALPKLNPYIPQIPTPKQALFLMLPHREAFFGGAGGGGKSSALLMAALQYVDYPNYAAIILRRTFSDLNKPGAIMDRAKEWLIRYSDVRWNSQDKRFTFPSGATLSFGYLENSGDHFQYQGAEFQFIGFDELTQFPENQYLYLYSRLRKNKDNPVPLRMRAAGNPGGRGHEWVKQRFIVEGAVNQQRVFIPAKMVDNPHLDQTEYFESLMQLDPVTREQMLNGNWDATLQGGMFKRFWFKLANESQIPWDRLQLCRYWDLAASEPSEDYKDPDWTVGTLAGYDQREGHFYILDVVRDRKTPLGVQQMVRETARKDGPTVHIVMEREGGASGKAVIQHYRTQLLQGYTFKEHKPDKDKVTRANPVSARAEAGDCFILSRSWTSEFLNEVAVFPSPYSHDDQVDTLTGAYEYLIGKRPSGTRQTAVKNLYGAKR